MDRSRILEEFEWLQLERLMLKECLNGSPSQEDVTSIWDALTDVGERQQKLSDDYWRHCADWEEPEVMAALADMRAVIRRVRIR